MKLKDLKNEVVSYFNHMVVSGNTDIPFEAWASDEANDQLDDEIKNSITYNTQTLAETILAGGV